MIRVFGLTDIGLIREENQDHLLILEPQDDGSRQLRGTLLAVADGMGGLGQGELASKIAIETISNTYYEASGEVREALRQAVEEANAAIYRYAQEQAGGQPMGSTLTAVAILGRYACVAHVGDSRAYYLSTTEIRQVTRDHSLVRELADRGEIEPDSFLYRQHRNVLTRGLGLCAEVDVDLFELHEVTGGDVLLLSTDGLHELVEPEELRQGIEAHGELEGLCRHFIDLARSRGAPDNVTVAVARIGEPPPAKAQPAETKAKDRSGLLAGLKQLARSIAALPRRASREGEDSR